MAKKDLDALNKKLEKIFKDNSETRRQYNRQYGQVFILDTELTEKIIFEALQGSKARDIKAASSAILRKMKRLLKQESTYGTRSYGMRRAKEYATRINAGDVDTMVLKPGQIAYAVRSYNTVNNIKSTIGKLVSRYAKRYKKDVSASSFTGSDNKSGMQLGHGDLSASIAVVKSLKIEQALARFGSNSKELLDGIQEIKEKHKEEHNLNISLQHEQVLTARGGFKKGYTAVFSSQATLENMMEAQDEKAFIQEVNDYISNNLANLKASPTLPEAIKTTLLHNFAEKKNLKVNTKTKSRSSSSSESRRRSKIKQNTPSVAKGGLVQRQAKKASNRRSDAKAPMNISMILGILNQRINKQVAGNMQSPALNYRTGRFAESVKVVDVQRTAQGFYSAGYTYQKNPYQTFEPGFAMGSVERDPRRLIDRSIREIAVEFAVGRFYTRRV